MITKEEKLKRIAIAKEEYMEIKRKAQKEYDAVVQPAYELYNKRLEEIEEDQGGWINE